jgi:hypothetical protein
MTMTLYVYDIPFLTAPEGCVRVRGLDELRALYATTGVKIRDLEPVIALRPARKRVRAKQKAA